MCNVSQKGKIKVPKVKYWLDLLRWKMVVRKQRLQVPVICDQGCSYSLFCDAIIYRSKHLHFVQFHFLCNSIFCAVFHGKVNKDIHISRLQENT